MKMGEDMKYKAGDVIRGMQFPETVEIKRFEGLTEDLFIFCNQMINYDIPWNPNKLEQRMGRIHRIGQRNEVFVFNLIAANTREGDVMLRLLNKLELMREDLGADLVYDFIGEVLEERYFDLPTLDWLPEG